MNLILKSIKGHLLIIVIAVVVAVWVYFKLTGPIFPGVIACDVGQGDALLVTFGSSSVLIDSGPNKAILRCLNQKLPFGQIKINPILLSHWDADHIGGFSDVSSSYRLELLLANPKHKDTQLANKVAQWVDDGGQWTKPFPGDVLVFPGGRLRILWSADAQFGSNAGNTDDTKENSRSIGVQGIYKGFGFLSLGDLECEQELAVASMPLLTFSQILKVSHHGSKSSSCVEFLTRIRPEIALVSVGSTNKYSHPDPEVMENLQNLGIFTLRTDVSGSLELQGKDERLYLWRER